MKDNVVFLVTKEELKDDVNERAVQEVLADHLDKNGWLKE